MKTLAFLQGKFIFVCALERFTDFADMQRKNPLSFTQSFRLTFMARHFDKKQQAFFCVKSLVLFFIEILGFSEPLIEKNLVFLLYRDVLVFLQKNQVFLLVIQIIQKNKIILMKNT